MIDIQVELWTWVGKELGENFQPISEMRSILKANVKEGIDVRDFFSELAKRYPSIGEKIFSREMKSFYPNILITFNDKVMGLRELHARVLKRGDKIRVVPMYSGG